MNAYWIKFTDGSSGCCEGQSAYDAKCIAAHITGKIVDGDKYGDSGAQILPYAATPTIWLFDHPVHGKSLPLCYSPEQCVGRTACPKSYACSE